MNDLPNLFVAAVVLASLLASIGIWSPRKLWIKGAAIVTAGALFGVSYLGLASLLSRPKPIALAWAERHLGEASVLAASIREGEGIYVWLEQAGEGEPRAYVLPWDVQTAEQLQQATATAEQTGTGVMMSRPFEADLNVSEPRFYAAPQPTQPEKSTSDGGPIIYDRPAADP